MILRKLTYVLLGLLTLSPSNAEDVKKYDNNDWIPIAQPCTDCKDEPKVPVVEKKAQGRVLNLADPPEANFFPEENKAPRANYQQFLRETTNVYQNPKRPQHRHKQPTQQPYRFESPPPPPPPPVHTVRQQRPQLQKPEPTQQQYYIQQPKQEFLNAPQFAQPPPGAQYFSAPQEYHTIPEEYLAQQGLQQPGNLPFFPQNYQTLPSIPDLPPIRLNASFATIQAINHELISNKKPTKHIDITSTTPKGEKESVQLLYVPLEALNQKQHKHELPRLHAYQQAPVAEVHQQFVDFRPQFNNNKQQQKIHDIESDFIRQALEAHKLQQQFHDEQQPYALPIIDTTTPPTTTTTTTTTTTRRPATKKRKPHQPPLAVYMGGDKNADIGDVLSILKDAKTIDVQDSVGPNSPKIFVGPSTLDAPNGYAKFELPYLSSIDNNRVERKVDQLPFFVAPLSYKTPPGYSKIPLPSPHVGSVVVSNKQKLHDSDAISKPVYTQQNQHTDFRQYQPRPHQIEEFTKRPVLSSTPKYARPIPEEHVINQYELDQINSFLPQYQLQKQQVQQAPEKYSFETFQPQYPKEYQHQFQQYQEQLLQRQKQPSQQFKPATQEQDLSHQLKATSEEQVAQFQLKPTQPEPKEQKQSLQKPKTYVSTIASPTQKTKLHLPSTQKSKLAYEHIPYPSSTPDSIEDSRESSENSKEENYSHEAVPHKTRPLNAQEQYTEEVIPNDKNAYDSNQQTRNTHSNVRVSSTPVPHGQYLKEVVSDDNYSYEDIITQPKPTHIRSRPSSTAAPVSQYIKETNRDHYNSSPQTRPPSRRTRPTTTPTPHEQYIKETIPEARPTHTRQRQSTTPLTRLQFINQYEEEIPEIRYYLNSESRPTPPPTRSSTPAVHQQYIEETLTPSSKQTIEQLYSPRPTHNSLPSSSKQPNPALYAPRPTHLTYADFDSREKTKYATADEPQTKIKPVVELPASYGEDEEHSVAPPKYVSKQESGGEQKYDLRHEPVYSSTHAPNSQNQHILNQEVLDSKILGQPQQDSANYISEAHLYRQNGLKHDETEEPLVHRTRTQYYPTNDPNESHEVKTQNANVENYNLPAQLSPSNQVLPSLINNLEDQSIRQLLHPGLVPTSIRNSELGHYEVDLSSTYPPPPPPTTTTTTTTTQAPTTYAATEPATTKKSRGRQRGNRYTTTTPSSYTARKTSQRGRRPLPPRTRYQDDGVSTTEYSVRTTTDPTKKIVNSRSRFRTRSRTPQSETPITDRVSTTERHYYDENIHVTPLQEHSTARILDTQQITHRIHPIDDEYAVSYQPIYNLPTERSHLIPVQKVLNVEVIRPANEPAIIQEINQLPIRNLEENHETSTTNRPSRSRPRIRGRPRTSTTETARTDAPRRQEASSEKSSDDEFYGFFREPNFKKPATEEPPLTEPPQKPVYSSTYVSSTLKPLVQYADEPYIRSSSVRYEENPSTPVHFVGEIRPKYHSSSTAQYYEVTQANLPSEIHYQSTPKEINDPNKVKIRGRIRVPSRRVTTEESSERQRTNNDLSSREEASVRTPQRIRTRGKVHFKPQNKRKDSAEDEDVEGGNYPPPFKVVRPQPSTPRPSFQITIDPSQDDQEPYPSIYRPTYVAKESGSKEDIVVVAYKSANDITGDNKSKSDEPSALPVISSQEEDRQNSSETNIDMLEKLIQELSSASQEDNNEDEVIDDITTTMVPDDITTKKGRRRGVWKLVKRPIDVLEGAESQHSSTINMNSFNDNGKVKYEGKAHILESSKEVTDESEVTTVSEAGETTTPISASTEGSFFNSLYEMFGISSGDAVLKDGPIETTTDIVGDEVSTILTDDKDVITQEAAHDPTEPDVITTTHKNVEFQDENEQNYDFPSSTPPPMTYVTPMSLESWNMGIIKTSTSTEISHETEICYKGRCIKSKDMKVPIT